MKGSEAPPNDKEFDEMTEAEKDDCVRRLRDSVDNVDGLSEDQIEMTKRICDLVLQASPVQTQGGWDA